MTWDELQQALKDHGSNSERVEVLIGDEYIAIELAMTMTGVMFFVPQAETTNE